MIKKIWKYELALIGKLLIEMPKDSIILKIGSQNNIPYLWALVNPESENEREFREIEIFQTDEEIFNDPTINRIYLDSLILSNGKLVVHVFERTKNTLKLPLSNSMTEIKLG